MSKEESEFLKRMTNLVDYIDIFIKIEKETDKLLLKKLKEFIENRLEELE